MIKRKPLSFLPVDFRPSHLCLLTALAAAPLAAPAQNDSGDTPPGADLPSPPRKFGENWRPSVKSAAAARNQAYAPIKAADDSGQIPEIEMFVGESRVFPAPGVARIAVGNGQIMSAASLDNKEVIVFANAVGTSSLFVWNEDGRYQRIKINIVPGDTGRFAREIAAFLSGIPNAKASVIGDKVIVEGDKLADQDIAKIDELAKRYPQIVNFTNRLGWEQMVLMDVKVVEFPTNELREIGLKWNATGGTAIGAVWSPIHAGDANSKYQINLQTGSGNAAPIVAAGGGTTVPLSSGANLLSIVNLGLNAQLSLLAQNGKAAILAEPQLSARNGAKANFLAGGEYPYTVSTINGPTIIFKPYGIKLEIAPQVDRHGTIRATIDSEVSAIDTSLSTTAGPALSTRRTKTEFNVRNGETMVLSGLLSRKTSNGIDKVPFLGDLPILGALFRSKRFQNDETELVVFVTPTVIDSQSPGLIDRIDRTSHKLQEELGRPPYLSDPIQPGRDPARPDQAFAVPRAASAETPRVVSLPIALQAAVSSSLPPVDAAPAATSNLRITGDGVYVRTAPSKSGAVRLQLDKGAVVTPGPKGSVGGWRHVQLAGIDGWVASQWLAAETAEKN